MMFRRDEKVREKVFIFFFTFEELNSMAPLNATFFISPWAATR